MWAVINVGSAWQTTHTNHCLMSHTSTSPWTGAVSDSYGFGISIGSGSGTGALVGTYSGLTGTVASATTGTSNPGTIALSTNYLIEFLITSTTQAKLPADVKLVWDPTVEPGAWGLGSPAPGQPFMIHQGWLDMLFNMIIGAPENTSEFANMLRKAPPAL
ncbi:MAG: hypothetical protein ACRENE_15225 [Polyangiaceae bacterium]